MNDAFVVVTREQIQVFMWPSLSSIQVDLLTAPLDKRYLHVLPSTARTQLGPTMPSLRGPYPIVFIIAIYRAVSIGQRRPQLPPITSEHIPRKRNGIEKNDIFRDNMS